MGLFSKKPEPQPQTAAKSELVIERPIETIYLNIPEKGVRVQLVDNAASFKYTAIRQAEDRILLVSCGILLAEVTKKTKAYSEIEPKVDHSALDAVIEAKNGDYGPYYRIRLRFADTVIIKN